MAKLKNSISRGLAALVLSLPLAVSSTSCDKIVRHNNPIEHKVDYKEQLTEQLNNKLHHWQSPNYETAKKWLIGYEAPNLPNKFAYFVVYDTGLVGHSKVKIEDKGELGVRIELDYAYARDVLAESNRLDVESFSRTDDIDGFP